MIRVWGKGAIEAVGRGFRAYTARPLEKDTSGRLWSGGWVPGWETKWLSAVLKTEIPAVEIQCHGGMAAVGMVLESLERAGVQRGGRWEIPGFDYPGGDQLSAEAIQDLAHAPTVLTAEILLDQVHGALAGRDRPAWPRWLSRTPRPRVLVWTRSSSAAAVGLRLLSGWKVVIAGRPNVGKSRLLNALCGFSRAIVDGTPGTTRDVVAFQTALGGWPVELADTAGLRATDDAIEHLGIERAERELGDCRPGSAGPRSVGESAADRPAIDRDHPRMRSWLPTSRISSRPGQTATPALDAPVVTVSAERGDGMDALVESMIERLVPAAPHPGEAVPFRPRTWRHCTSARDELLAGNIGSGGSRARNADSPGSRRLTATTAASFALRPSRDANCQRLPGSGG